MMRPVVESSQEEQDYFIHETKYAVLAVILFIIFVTPWVGTCMRNVFPGCKGPLVIIYKAVLFFLLFYIIQKTDWFQNL